MWIVINSETGAMLAGPLDVVPEAEEGQTVLSGMPPGYGIEWLWDPVTRGRKDLVPASPLMPVARFKLLLTMQERIDIRAAGETDAVVKDCLDLLNGFTNGIALNDPLLAQMLGLMVSKQLLSEERHGQILAGQSPH